MAKVINNIKKSVSNTVGAAASTVAVSSQVLADSTGMITSTVEATPAVLKALLQAPFAAAKGYLQEAEGLTAEEAEARAYLFLRQKADQTVTDGAEAIGGFLADMFKDDDTDDTKKKEEGNS